MSLSTSGNVYHCVLSYRVRIAERSVERSSFGAANAKMV